MTQLNSPKRLKKIKDEYFVKMMLPDSEEKALPYVNEEEATLKKLLNSNNHINDFNFVVVGSGTLWYLDIAYGKVKNYIAVEPLADIFIHEQVRFILQKHKNIKVIGEEFGEYEIEQPLMQNSMFVFHFNILSYIPNPIRRINKYLKEGDILYISSWNSTIKAKSVRKNYFDYLNANTSSNSYKINPDETTGLCNLDVFPFDKLKFYKSHERIKGEITDILIIYC